MKKRKFASAYGPRVQVPDHRLPAPFRGVPNVNHFYRSVGFPLRMTAAILETLGKMEPDPTDIGVEANCVMQYLSNFPGEFISEREIARRADGKERFLKDPHWAHNAFSELIELGLLETDGGGRYRQKTKDAKAVKHGAKFLDPKLRAILEKSNHGFDLSNYD